MTQESPRPLEDLRSLAEGAVSASVASQDPDYPLVHVVPPVGRLNDPNGLLVDGGVYHAFYQFSPFHPGRKLVYWGHSSSTDLMTWTEHGAAIVPDSPYDRSGAYSGNALVAEGEELDVVPGGAPFQLFFTGNLKDPVTDERTSSQCVATSRDLARFEKLSSNPVIPEQPEGYTAHFRDPQVWRDPDRPGSFRMLLGVQRSDSTGAALLYRSSDLVDWECEGELGFPDAGGAMDRLGFMWECPGIVRLADEATGEERDVLIWCPQGAGAQSGEHPGEGFGNVFPCTYAVGTLVGTELRGFDGVLREVDAGFEFYAPQVFARRPSEPGPALLMGWAGNAGEDDQPSIASGGWVHSLTCARRLSLRGGRLVQRLELPAADGAARLALSGTAVPGEWTAVEELSGSRSWHLALGVGEPHRRVSGTREDGEDEGALELLIGEEGCGVLVRLEVSGGRARRLVVDRSSSRYGQHGAVRSVRVPEGAAARLEVLHDRSVTEVVVGDGDLVFTLRSFVAPGSAGARVRCEGCLVLGEAAGAALD